MKTVYHFSLSLSVKLVAVAWAYSLAANAIYAVDAPQAASAQAAGPETVAISWQDIAIDETSYEVEINGSSTVSLPANSDSYYHRGLTANTAYSYRVRSVQGGNASSWVSAGSATTTGYLNIIFFLADDMGYKDIVSLRDPEIDGPTLHETPELDTLAGESVVFTNAYCSGPRCVVARRSMLLGKYDWRPEGIPNGGGIALENVTYAEPIQASGYRTAYIGKYHLGESSDSPARGPQQQGFDVSIAAGEFGAPPNSYFALETAPSSGTYTYGLPDLDGTDYMLPTEATAPFDGEYLTDRMTQKAKGFIYDSITNHASAPFFLTLAHYAVHTPVEAKQADIDYFTTRKNSMSAELANHPGGSGLRQDITSADRIVQDNRLYAALMKSYDDSLGELRSYLAATDDPRNPGKKLSETTIIVVSSDHGGKSSSGYGSGASPSKSLENDATDAPVFDGSQPNNYSNYPTSNYPFRLGKTWVYEGGLKIPLMVYYPGLTTAGAVSDSLVHGADFFSSFADMAGALPDAEATDSVSFMLSAVQPTAAARKESHHFFTNASTGTANMAIGAYRKGDYKLLYYMVQRKVELYNLAADPYERDDLALSRPDLVEEMLDELYREVLAHGTKMPKPGSNTWQSEQENLVANGLLAALPPVPDAAPDGLTLTQLSETAIQLDWTVNATNATHSVIYRSGVDERNNNGGDDSYREIGYVPVGQTTFVDTNFTSTVGEKYKYRVESENISGWNSSTIHGSGLYSTLNSNNGTTNTGNVILTLASSSPRAVDAVNDTVRLVPGEVRTFTPTLNDVGEGELSIQSIGTPSVGTATTDGVRITFTAPESFSGTATLDYTLVDSAAQTDTATIMFSLPVQPAATSLELWNFDKTAGTKLHETASTSTLTFGTLDTASVATDGNGNMVFAAGTSNASKTTTGTVKDGPYTSGKFRLEYRVASADWTNSADNVAVGFALRDQNAGEDFGLIRLHRVSGEIHLQLQIFNGSGFEVTTLHDFNSLTVSDLVIAAELDLDAATIQIAPELSISGGAFQSLGAGSYDVNPGASSFDRLKLQSNIGGMVSPDTVVIDYLSLGEVNETTIYSAWAQSHSWQGVLETGVDEDPDGDGLSNLIEFAFGTSPTAANPSRPVTLHQGTGGPVIRFTPMRDTTTLNYQAETSSNLSSWTPVAVNSAAGVEVEVALPSGDEGFARVVVTTP